MTFTHTKPEPAMYSKPASCVFLLILLFSAGAAGQDSLARISGGFVSGKARIRHPLPHARAP